MPLAYIHALKHMPCVRDFDQTMALTERRERSFITNAQSTLQLSLWHSKWLVRTRQHVYMPRVPQCAANTRQCTSAPLNAKEHCRIIQKPNPNLALVAASENSDSDSDTPSACNGVVPIQAGRRDAASGVANGAGASAACGVCSANICALPAGHSDCSL